MRVNRRWRMRGRPVVPVVVEVRLGAVPAAKVSLQRRMVPLHTCVVASYHSSLTPEAEFPDSRGLYLGDVPFHPGGLIGSVKGGGNRQCAAHVRIGVNLRDIGASGELFHQAAVACDLDHVHDPERLVRDAAFLQQRKDRRLGAVRNLAQRVDYEAAFRELGVQSRRRRQVSLPGQHDQGFGRASVRGLIQHASGNLRTGCSRGSWNHDGHHGKGQQKKGGCEQESAEGHHGPQL